MSIIDPRLRWIIAFMIMAVVAGAGLLRVRDSTRPLHIESTAHDARIDLRADRDRALFPGECVWLSWRTEGIREIYLNGLGIVGEGEREWCLWVRDPAFAIHYQDGAEAVYVLPVQQTYQSFLVVGLWAGWVVGVAGLAYTLGGVNALLIALVVLLIGPYTRFQINQSSDAQAHTFYAQLALDSTDLNSLPPQRLYHLLAIGLHTLLPGVTMEQAGFYLSLAAHVLCALGIYALLRMLTFRSKPSLGMDVLLASSALLLMMADQLSFVGQRLIPNYTGGAITPNSYHSPTTTLLRPFAIWLFWAILIMWRRLEGLRPAALVAACLGSGCLAALGVLAKPSYAMALMPALGVVAVGALWRRRWRRCLYLTCGIALPMAAVLAWQFSLHFGGAVSAGGYLATAYGGSASLAFAPLEYVALWHGTPPWWLLPELALAALFPLTVTIVFWREARRDFALALAWGVFLAGASLTYLLIERGEEGSGNLTWSGQVSLLILFVIAAGFVLKRAMARWWHGLQPDWRLWLCIGVFALHLANPLL